MARGSSGDPHWILSAAVNARKLDLVTYLESKGGHEDGPASQRALTRSRRLSVWADGLNPLQSFTLVSGIEIGVSFLKRTTPA
jgi:hypothetical protein